MNVVLYQIKCMIIISKCTKMDCYIETLPGWMYPTIIVVGFALIATQCWLTPCWCHVLKW